LFRVAVDKLFKVIIQFFTLSLLDFYLINIYIFQPENCSTEKFIQLRSFPKLKVVS